MDVAWIKNEWIHILKNKKQMAAIFVILFVPTLYSGTYLWANWDPYAHLERLPVAVVNEDVKVHYKGKTYAIGNELVKELKKDKSFNWRFVNKEKADTGLKNNQYYFEIFIPDNFSKRATTLTSQKPIPLNLYYKVDVGSNFIASQIGTTGVDKIRTKLSQQLSKNYAEVVFGDIASIGNSIEDASNGSKKITTGISQLSSGTKDIVNGMQTQVGSIGGFSSGAQKLSNAATQISSGAGQIQVGMTQVRNGFSSLGTGLSSLNTSSGQLASGLPTLLNGSRLFLIGYLHYQCS